MTATAELEALKLIASTEKTQLELKLLDGSTCHVAARVVGPLAVHPHPGVSPDEQRGWRITHVATSFSVKRGIASEAQAVAVAQRLQSLDWNFQRKEDCHVDRLAVFAAVKEVLSRE